MCSHISVLSVWLILITLVVGSVDQPATTAATDQESTQSVLTLLSFVTPAQAGGKRDRSRARRVTSHQAGRNAVALIKRQNVSYGMGLRQRPRRGAIVSTSHNLGRTDHLGQFGNRPAGQIMRPPRPTRPSQSQGRQRFVSPRTTVPNELLVFTGAADSVLGRAGRLGYKTDTFGSKGKGGSGGLVRLKVPAGTPTETAFQIISQHFNGASVYYNRRYRPYASATENDKTGWHTSMDNRAGRSCTRRSCYGAQAIGWSSHIASCALNLRIGVIDSAVDITHPTFRRRNISVKRVHDGRPPKNASEHGTGILALLAGDASSATPGLIPDAQFRALDIFFADQDGEATSDSLSLYRALKDLEAWGAHVINLSLVGPVDALVGGTIQRLSEQGIVFIAAAGNDGPAGGKSYPAGYESVIAVTAVDKRLRSYRYANRGRFIDLSAPGVDIWTALPGRREGLKSGTSLAVPFVTAVVATRYAMLARYDRLSVLSQITSVDLGKSGIDPVYGRGLVQAPRNCKSMSRKQLAAKPGRLRSATVAMAQNASAGLSWQKQAFASE